jgi:hypothetical protein
MPNITLSDSSSASIDAAVLDTSAIGKTPNAVLHFLRSDVIGALDQTLDKVQINMVSTGFNFNPSFSFNGGSATFQAGGGLTGEIDLYKPSGAGVSSQLFTEDQYGTSIDMGDSVYLALAFQLGMQAGGSEGSGAFCIQPNMTSGATAKFYLPFAPSSGIYPTLKAALVDLCNSYALPSSIDDLRKLTTGTVLTFDASGTIEFDASVDVLAAVSPTATPGIVNSFGPVSISAGPSVTVAGEFSLTGELQVRIWKKSETEIQLGYYKKRGSSLQLSCDESVGVNVRVAHFDVLAKIYELLGDSGKLDETWLKQNVPDAVAQEVATAYQTSVQRKLSIAIDAECDSAVTNQSAFSWKFNLPTLDADGIKAFDSALHGDLSRLMSKNALPNGVLKVGSVFDRIKDRGHTLTFNFLGLFDHATVSDSLVDISSKVSEDGQLILTDTAHVTRLSADVTPFIKSEQLQKVVAEDCVSTIGYLASCGSLAPSVKVNYRYFDYKSHANVSDLGLFISIAEKLLGTFKTDDWSSTVQSMLPSQQASFLAEFVYDDKTGRRLFVDQNSISRQIPDYEQIGRTATLITPGITLSDSFAPWLADDFKWKQIRDAGTMQNFCSIIGVDQLTPPAWATVSFTWTLHIILWAGAMHSAATAFQNLLQYLDANARSISWQDQEFMRRRQTFASQLNTAIQKAPLFHNALGLLIMFNGAQPSEQTVTIRYGGLSKTYS